jgi:hypothetical protein
MLTVQMLVMAVAVAVQKFYFAILFQTNYDPAGAAAERTEANDKQRPYNNFSK